MSVNKILIPPVWVSGRSYYQAALEHLSGGDHEAVLTPEPENAFDPGAIRVDVGPTKIGYVPRDCKLYKQVEARTAAKVQVVEPSTQGPGSRKQWAAMIYAWFDPSEALPEPDHDG